ncbi:Oxidoreductase family, NAD-binding Rossmann fold [Geosmithia morbida]|uniref:D-xylose 1-dehydrogenase (NADP(+), D-xylono-1,5-lactone-forming) n=1 Tax=Geosmithia morbida TaxID=1094350 RepID=A0A9P4YZG2_9HYPO|nr:Oxidoreductase family, NAD-binding Rossmann fold [Geosmithia morbida]KAF4123854.1 Oxidoreductase family, NAD-binding Rossmann fold [Geosmithia morbida]
MSSPYTVRWGIMATGGIAETFCKDLLTDPSIRGVNDVKHEIVAVASSRSADGAANFVKRIDGPASAKTYGSYADLVADPAVDIVYVATPHSHHFQNAMLCLEAGKNVLCEKAFTVTVAQTKKLVETAKAKNLFLMEAVWTRYFPLSTKVRELITSGAIGKVYRTMADLSFSSSKPDGTLDFDPSNRMINSDLAGGALLDLGIYSLTWVFQTLYHTQQQPAREAPKVVAAINKYPATGVDEQTSIICQWPQSNLMGIATTNLRVSTDPDGKHTAGPAIRIQGSEGEIQVYAPAYRPLKYRVVRKDSDGKAETVDCPIPSDPERGGWGHGMFWEADECARCLRDGRKESETMPWSESIAIMQTMDEALAQGGVVYPELITTHVYDAKSPLNKGNQ